MWTPRRILILLASLLLLLGGYYVYVLMLGHYDGLRPLPEEHLPSASFSEDDLNRPMVVESSAVRQLKLAFGPNCKEAHRPIQLELKNQGVVLAAGYWRLLENGNLGLDLVSVAIFGKPTADGRPGEINTVRGVRAEIRFDQPLRSLRDANDKNRKAIGGRLEGGFDTEIKQRVPVHLRNNRRTGDPDDDLHLYTDWLEFLDEQHRVWTEAPVELVEGVRPEATVVTAKGMEVLLVPGESPPAASTKRNKPTVAGVKSVRLDRQVRMDLLIDNRSAFMSGNQPSETPPPLGAKAEKGRLVISSRGSFMYALGTEQDRAEFNDHVEVIRPHGLAPDPEDQDELRCNYLLLVFQRKQSDDKRRFDDRGSPLDLVSAHAVGNPLELSSDTKGKGDKPPERLRATGTEVFFEKATNQTTLKGLPVEAEKDGHQLRLRGALILQNFQKSPKEAQEVKAIGPGEARLRGKDGNPSIIARWKDEFHSARDAGDDRIVLIGQASFEDPERGRLSADRLLIVLAVMAGDENAGEQRRRIPRYLEANDNVSLTSPQLVIPKTNRLRLEIQDRQASAGGAAAGILGGLAERMSATASRPVVLPEPESTQKSPLMLTAGTIDAKLSRDRGRTEIDQLDAEGKVLVTQDAAYALDPAGKPVSANKELRLEGTSLKLTRAVGGNKLRIVGVGEPGQPQLYEPAFVQVDRLRLLGPAVEIEQPDNIVCVNGPGSMKLPSKSDFQGKPLKEPVDVTIDWTEQMLFDGRHAEFRGKVTAVQEHSSLACHELYVELDQSISLKERKSGKSDQPISIARLAGEGKVCLEKKSKEGDKWKEFQRIEGSQLLFEKAESKLTVSGPGYAYFLQSGMKPAMAGQPKPAADAGEPKLTRIAFSQRMKAGKGQDRKTDTVEFTGKIHLINLPTSNPDVVIDEAKLPAGAIALECNELQGWSLKTGDQTSDNFRAIGQVRVWAKEAKGQDFIAQADQASYDESKDLLILKSEKTVTIWRQQQPGGDFETVSAKEIWYWRKENRIRTDQTTDIGVKP